MYRLILKGANRKYNSKKIISSSATMLHEFYRLILKFLIATVTDEICLTFHVSGQLGRRFT